LLLRGELLSCPLLQCRALSVDGVEFGLEGGHVDAGHSWLGVSHKIQVQDKAYAGVPTTSLWASGASPGWQTDDRCGSEGVTGSVDTMVGRYPSWLQTFHFAAEYATHVDDIYVLVPDEDRRQRSALRRPATQVGHIGC
jgi:hypothetical protein